MRWLALGLVLSAGCGRIGFDETVNYPDLEFRKAITITPPADMTEVVEDIPIHVGLVDPDLAAAVNDADGDDVAFSDAAGDRLPWEVAGYDGATGTLDSWVRIPQLVPGESVTIYLHYGGKPHTPGTPWAADVAGVWHMDLRTGGIVTDSGDLAHHSMPGPVAELPTAAPGIAGGALRFDGIDDVVGIGDPPDGSLDFGMRSFSYGLWANVTTTLGLYDTPLHKGGSSVTRPGYDLELGQLEWSSNLTDTTQFLSGDHGIGDPTLMNRWTQLMVVIDREAGVARYFTNGVEAANQPLGNFGSVDSDFGLTFGRDAFVFRGTLDEVRIYGHAISASWIAVEYANLAERASFMTVGVEQN